MPPWFKPSYDSGAVQLPKQDPRAGHIDERGCGEDDMVTELFESYDQFESKRSFPWALRLAHWRRQCPGALGKASDSPAFRISKLCVQAAVQAVRAWGQTRNLRVLPVLEPIFGGKIDLEDKSAARPPPSDGIMATWTAEDVGAWLKRYPWPVR